MIDLCVDIETTGLDFFQDKIIAIGYKSDTLKGSFIGEEKEVLEQFLRFYKELNSYATYPQVRIVGYNVLNFDVPFIFYRAVKHDLDMGSFLQVVKGYKDYNHNYITDLYILLRLKIFNNNFKLTKILECWGLPGKFNGFSGEMAKDLSREDLKSYVEQDVEIEWLLYKKLQEVGVI